MPVHEVQYKPWVGHVMPPSRRVLAIPKFTFLSVFNRWLATVMFGAGSLQVIVWSAYIVVTTNPLVRQALQMDLRNQIEIMPHDIFRTFYKYQIYGCLVACLFAAPRMISQELAHKALPLVYSRPISRAGYILGKFLTLNLVLGYMTWVQATLLYLVMLTNYPSSHTFIVYFWSYAVPLGVRVLLTGFIMSGLLSVVALACSAATKNIRYAALIYLALIAGVSFVSTTVKSTFLPSFPEIGVREVIFSSSERLLAAQPVGPEPVLAAAPSPSMITRSKAPPPARQYEFMSLLDDGDSNETKAAWQRPNRIADMLTGQVKPIAWWLVLVGIFTWFALSVGFMLWRLRPVDVYSE